jgi:prepilin-type N-terminal cleavage/methylation domain-containing protein
MKVLANVTGLRERGFTLVELLIVTVIIGILAGMMVMVMGAATDGADAARLINDLRLVKSAVLLYYFANDDWPSRGLPEGASPALTANIEGYLDTPFAGRYSAGVFFSNSGGRIMYGLSPDEFSAEARRKLLLNGSLYKSDGSQYDGGSGPFYTLVSLK